MTQQQPQARRALVVGLGATGLSCVRYLRAQGYEVSVVDSRAAPPALAELRRTFPEVACHTGGFDERLFQAATLLVVSPGVSLREPAVARTVARGVEALGDIELFARAAKAPILAVTGANGKSTVTSLTGAMCREAGLATAVGGNIGVPALELLAQAPTDVYVLELSSFQLETTASLRPLAATVLNITPDHMDRYRDLDEYAAAKARVFRGEGVMVLNADDPRVMAMGMPGRTVVRFGLGAPASEHDYGLVMHGGEEWLAKGERRLLPAGEVPLAGRHNLANVLAAMALAEAAKVPFDAMKRAILHFKGLAHRTELVAERDGVRWINDSKGTNVGATLAALNGMTGPAVLIAGGDGKGQDFSPLKQACARQARAVVLIGRDAACIEAAITGCGVPLHHAKTMDEAVGMAFRAALAGDAVLLSPACASFDMFRNYEHRAQVFIAAVQKLQQERAA
jgi:UDP-N-acetylmuramoylalanine--D-glutamate ligase